MLDDNREKCDKNDSVKNVFSLFSLTSNIEEKVIKFWPLKFKDKEEELLYIVKICDNIYKKRFFILISHMSSLLFMYSICLIVGRINDLFSILRWTFMFLHIFVALNIIMIIILHYTHYIEKFKTLRGKIFVIFSIFALILWCSWLFILFSDVKEHLPVVVNVNNFLYATYTHNKINVVLCFFAYIPIIYLITVLPCRICYSYIFDLLFFIMKIAIYSFFYIITIKNYILIDNIFMIASSLIGSIFIFMIRYIIEIQRRLSFHNWNKQIKQIIKLKINLKEEKEKLSLTNIEEIFIIINNCIGNFNSTNLNPEDKNFCIVNNLKKILNILKEDNLFSPDRNLINKKNYNHIYDYLMGIKKNKATLENMEEFKDESEIESLIESVSETRSKLKLDLQSKSFSKIDEMKSFKSDFEINMNSENLNMNTWNTMFLNQKTVNDDIFIQIGNHLLHKYYTSSKNIPNEILCSLLHEMKSGYNDVPYHNSIHAAMVTQQCNILVNNLETANILQDNEMAAFFVASLGHDIGHFGRTNIFLKNCSNFLSIIYNDKSILENYHCSYLFHILLKEKNNIFKNENSRTLITLRQQIIELILATDMSKHIKILAQFRIKSIKMKSYIEKNIVLCLKMIIKAADLSHNCVDWSEHYLWVKRLVNEFYFEGDEELERGNQIHPLFDRRCHDNFIQIQRTFLKELVYPLVISLKTLDKSTITQCMIEKVKRNYSKWTKIEKNSIKKKKYLNELLCNIPESWKNYYKPNLDIYQLEKCK
ncbi:phosphodiesterase gamma, putative [Plasmodium gallinaceum]|uniref:Phosphodiesterase n=1 Tax=Plasmodium gallinaceum TaxID=5849 RepID=A0A1J1H2N3_PLAGA|nr:phosphodiesterase gamma, putative [Plasmodium gallinaceum]CRG97606.1 phosphodiesterase gamma, putative [Plasmodium gallinaceum]